MKLVLFDIDGTLCDSTQLDDESFYEAFEEVFELDIRKKDWSELKNVTDWGLTEELVYESYSRYPEAHEYQALETLFLNKLKSQITSENFIFSEIPGAVDFFHHLKNDHNTIVGLATGGWESTARLKLEKIGIEYQNLPFGHSNLHKSREQIMLYAIEEAQKIHQTNFEKTVYFGDGVWDYHACKKLQIPFIGIDYYENQRLSNLGTKTVFKDFSDMNPILDQLNLIE